MDEASETQAVIVVHLQKDTLQMTAHVWCCRALQPCDIVIFRPGALVRSVACPLSKQRFRDRCSHTAHSFMEK